MNRREGGREGETMKLVGKKKLKTVNAQRYFSF